MNHLMDKMEQVRKLTNGIGIQNILDEAYKILGNPIAMNNTEYTLMAYTEAETDDPIWNELIELGTFGEITQRFFEQAGFIEEVANNRIAYLTTEHLKYDRINGKLFSKNNTHISNLVIVACNKPFEEGDQKIFEKICKFMSKEISDNESYQQYEQAHQEMILKNLIDGNYDIKLDIAQVSIIYDSLESNVYIMVVDISQCDTDYTDIVYCRDLLKQTEPAYKYAIYSNYIIIIISTNYDNINVNKDLKGLIEIFNQHNMYAGISGKFENLFELKKYYMQALQAMQCALEVRSDQRVFPCNESSRNKMEQIKNLKSGKGIQYFLNKGMGILGNPLLFHDMELNLLAYTENVEIIDPIWQELITYGTSSDETIELFRTEGFIDIMDNAKGGAILISGKIKYDRISWRIYNNDNIRIGCTSIVNTMKPFSEDGLVLFGAFSQKFSKEVGKIEFYNKYGQVYSETVISRLISGKIDDYTFYSEDIGSLYDNLMENIYLAVVDTTQCTSEQVTLNYLRDMLNRQNTLNRYAIYSNYIVIIISMDNTLSLDDNNGFSEISKIFEQNNIYAGISRRFKNIYELQRHYNEAVNALHSGIKRKKIKGGTQRFLQHGKVGDDS